MNVIRDQPLLAGGDAPWCNCPSEWCSDINYRNPGEHAPISCSATSTVADLPRFQRHQSAELTHNATIGHWLGYAYSTDPVKSYVSRANQPAALVCHIYTLWICQ